MSALLNIAIPDEGTEGNLGVVRATSPLLERSPCPRSPRFPCPEAHGRVPFSTSARDKLGHAWGEGSDGYFPCPIPGHRGRATFVFSEGKWRVACCKGRERSPAEVRAARAYGADRLLSNIELAIWWRRLSWELGDLDPLRVEIPPLFVSTPEAESVREGFALLLGLRQWDYRPRPVAYSVRFAAAWVGISKAKAHAGIRAMRDQGVVSEAGRVGRVTLYEPGPGFTLEEAILDPDHAEQIRASVNGEWV